MTYAFVAADQHYLVYCHPVPIAIATVIAEPGTKPRQRCSAFKFTV